jgi:hypothetical protein
MGVIIGVVVGAPAQAQERETVTGELKIPAKIRSKKVKTIDLGAKDRFEARYHYQIEGNRRLLPLQGHLRRCIDAQRMIGGEFHDRLDFLVEPSGKVKQFSARRGSQLQACLTPHVLGLRFPRFKGKETFLLQVLVGSPACKLGRRRKAKPVPAVYPMETEKQKKKYRMALYWTASPWSQAISSCAELVDRRMGFGYRFQMALEVNPAGRVKKGALSVRGPLARAAFDRYARCAMPFLKGMRLPRHAGPEGFVYKMGSSTARWEPDDD